MTSPVLFQFLPPLAPDEYAALERSIREYGVQVPITVDEHGVVIDGHHRQTIAQSLGVHCPQTRVFDKTDLEKRTLALTLNLDRRNLTREQRRAIVEASVKADPQLSDRAHAQRTGVTHPTVARVREQLEQVERFTTSPQDRTDWTPDDRAERDDVDAVDGIGDETGEVMEFPSPRGGTVPAESFTATEQQDPSMDLPPSLPAPRPASVVGLDGKTYTRPAPVERGPIRRPLREGFRDAALDLDKLVGRFERLVGDDRYPRNRNEVAPYRNDLIRARDALDRLIEQMSN